ncbi:MAG: hypothetical protein M3077_06810 [Candidatus Dormibacteraeota bacterium]|nr:hypothetical protein [Candidatus Dormibacteraeota bacterium]
MDLLEVLRRQAGRFQCPECGKSLADCRLDLVAKADAQSLVRVTCANCAHERLIAVAVAAPAETTTPPVRDEPSDPAAPSITADEMLDVRLALASYEGDLKGLLG